MVGPATEGSGPGRGRGTAAHPLTPLSEAEVVEACAVVRAAYPQRCGSPDAGRPHLRFPVVALAEPDRPVLRAWTAGTPLPRRAEVVVVERASGRLVEAVVDLQRSTVVGWDEVAGAVPPLLLDECSQAIDAVKADPRWRSALADRGITDVEHVQVDPWPAGNFGSAAEEGRRLTRCVSYWREDGQDNGYAHPIEGLVALVDLATGDVLGVADDGPVPVPAGHGRYGAGDVGPLRSGLAPLEITQPDGPSFELDGNEVRWLGWRLRFTVHPIEGLVLHGVGFQDGDRFRTVLDRASIAEMVVPYGATGPNHWWKNAFDAGEWGLGRTMGSLTLGCDCLGEIRYADAVLPDERGGARRVANAVCLHEEDFGILWKHVDLWSGQDEVRRSRRLVISSVSTVGNYDYGFFWYLYLDGTIQLEVKLTGILQTGACDPTAATPPDHGVLLTPGLWAPIHQHLFCARLDVAVDGPDNAVEEIDVVGLEPGPDNEHGNAIAAVATLLTRESEAQRLADPARSRRWKIVNRGAVNPVGQPTAYALVPGPAVTLLAHPRSSVAARAAFATRNLWVTPYVPAERRPAGNHPNQHPGGAGLPAWTAADRPIVDTELVVWHTFGVSHLPRPEDFPVMPVEYTGFHLRPVGFFERNPALDLPPGHRAHCPPG